VTGAVLACGVAGGWAVAETLGWEPIQLVGAGDRAVGPFGSSAYLGAALALLAPVAIGVALDTTWSTNARRLATAAALARGAGHVASGARAAWAGALIAAVVTTWVRRPQVTPRVAAAVAVMTAAVVVVLALATGVAHRVPDVVHDRDGGARGRLDEWRVATRVIADHPVLGTGPEAYRIAFGKAVDDDYEIAHGRDPLPDRAHSAPLDVAATTGLAGLAAYAALVLMTGALVLRALRTAPPWLAGAAVGLVAYAAQGLFLFPIAELEPVAWLLAGALVAGGAPSLTLVPRRWTPIVAGMLAAAALAAGTLDVVADRAARDQDGDPTRAARLRPDALRYHLVAARRLPPAQAITELDRALAVSPRDPVVRSERARLLLAEDPDKALEALIALARDDPRNAQVLLRLGLAHALVGQRDEAEAAWRRAEHLAPRSAAASTNLAIAYAQRERWVDAAAAARRALARQPGNARARAVLDEARKHGT
jgi:tetratricopeptide (TPR) repeat protein